MEDNIEINNPSYNKFCELYIDSGNATESYRKVFPNASYEAARVSASRLLERPEVQELIKKKQNEFKQVRIHPSREEQFLKIKRGMELALQKNQLGTYAKLIEIENRMLGYNAPDQIEHLSNSPVSVVRVTTVVKDNNKEEKQDEN